MYKKEKVPSYIIEYLYNPVSGITANTRLIAGSKIHRGLSDTIYRANDKLMEVQQNAIHEVMKLFLQLKSDKDKTIKCKNICSFKYSEDYLQKLNVKSISKKYWL